MSPGPGPGRRSRWGPPWAGSGERPPWWPADESWPPAGGRRRRRGFGCLFSAVFLLGVLGVLAIGTSLVGALLGAPGPFGHLIRLAATLVAIALVVGAIRGGWALRRSGGVLDDLVDQAARVEAGDYKARVDLVGPAPGPVRALTRGFNTMAARLEADEAQRRSLLADVTHELRTPLTVIAGNVEAILDGVHPADDAHLGAILDETRVLSRLVEDLRTLTLSEAGSLSLHREPTDLDVLVGDLATAFSAAAEEGGVTLETEVADDVPLIDVDPVRIREVLGNLVTNALRHTPAGGRVAVRAGVVPGETIEITVRDTGSGIDPELLPHVFDRFARGAGSSGTGLGLSIARSLVDLHGGSIEARSLTDGGTEIRIRLPITPRPI